MYKRGQVTIFVIIALVIVGIIIAFIAYPRISIVSGDVNPSSYLSECINPMLEESLEIVSKQGGSFVPDNYLVYQDEKIQYLCYTAEDYKPCIVQQPLLVRHIEIELKEQIEPQARQCVQDLMEEYERDGYSVQSTPGEVNVSILPGQISVDFNAPMTVTKENTQTFQKFAVSKKSEMYGLLGTAVSIIQFESTLGDSETTLYLQYYPDLKIEKLKRGDDTIYTLSNVITREEFTFATRSLVWPQGYGLE